jgi:hypothetical protein
MTRRIAVPIACALVACGGATPQPSPSPGGGKPSPHLVAFEGCSADGLGEEIDLNRAKNRDDDTGAPDRVPQMELADFLADTGPAAPKHRAHWSPDVAAQVARREGHPLALAGVLLHARKQHAEECNCQSASDDLHDVHINLVAQDGQGADASAIVEVTPRIRRLHPKWTDTSLKKLTGRRVRVTGWVTFDNEHQDMITKGERRTLWEIHPILHFEVWQDGAWRDVDSVL